MNIPAKNTIEAKDFSGVSPNAMKVAMKKAAQGNGKAFRVIFNAFNERLTWRFIAEYKVDANVAKDLAIEVISKVWEKAGSYDSSKAHVTTWVYSIAHFHFIDYKRQNQKRESIFSIYDVLFTDYREIHPKFEAHELSATPEQLLMDDEKNEFVESLLSEKLLGKKLFKIMKLRYEKDLSLKEVAQETGTNESTVRTSIFRAKNLIKDFLKKNAELANCYALPSYAL